jgi:hypothetical protein
MPPSEDRGPLTRQLQLWAAFLVGVVLLAGVLTVVVDVEPTLPAILPLALSAAMAAGAVLAVLGIDRVFAATPPADDTAAVSELRTRMVLQSVLAETLVLATTILAAMVGPRWNIAIGGLGALAILLHVRPRARRLARFDAAWAAHGSEVSLTRALTGGGGAVR